MICRLIVLIHSGNRLGLITIDGAHEHDWEDIACGPCTGGSGNCIYLADTGGNAGPDANTVWRIKEPSHIGDQHVKLDSFLKFRFVYVHFNKCGERNTN